MYYLRGETIPLSDCSWEIRKLINVISWKFNKVLKIMSFTHIESTLTFKAYSKDEFLIKPSLLHPCYEQKLLLIPSVFKSSWPVAFAGMVFKMVWSWSTSFLVLMASSRFLATSAPGNSPNRKLEAIQKTLWQLHFQSWFDLCVGHRIIKCGSSPYSE